MVHCSNVVEPVLCPLAGAFAHGNAETAKIGRARKTIFIGHIVADEERHRTDKGRFFHECFNGAPFAGTGSDQFDHCFPVFDRQPVFVGKVSGKLSPPSLNPFLNRRRGVRSRGASLSLGHVKKSMFQEMTEKQTQDAINEVRTWTLLSFDCSLAVVPPTLTPFRCRSLRWKRD